MGAPKLDLVQLIETHLRPNLVPLLVALVAVFVATLAVYVSLRRGDAAAQVKAKAQRTFRAYTRAEVAAHNSADDCWVLIKLKQFDDTRVFDLTEYVEEHPGGEAIFRNAGGDATGGFYGPHHPPRAHDMITEFCIGTLAD